MFGNWGAMPSEEKNAAQRRRVELQLRHCPAHILRLAECEGQMEAILQRPGKPPPQDADAPGAAAAAAASGAAPAAAGAIAAPPAATSDKALAGNCHTLQSRP